ncbi:MAG: hypothetical protein FWF11_01205 [Coriobacteriia bacterium]|nr:hypothetical protein [Coriobacteriia bacterium]
MDVLRNLFSLSWWSETLSQLTFADLQARWQLIQQAVANPQSQPLIALLALAIVLVFVLIVMLTLAMWYYARTQQKTEYELLDEEGNAVKTIDEKTAQELLAGATDITIQSKINYAAVLGSLLTAVAIFIGFGFSTRSEVYCLACHESPHEVVAEWPVVDAHSGLTCVNCHEPGTTLQGVTINLVPRSIHSVAGIFTDPEQRDAVNRGTYGSVLQTTCEGCHGDYILPRPLTRKGPDRVTVRVSHYEPLQAGMPCVQCHVFTRAQEMQLVQTGMQNCISCHNGSRARVECIVCHINPPAETRQRDIGTVWSRALIHDRPDARCYDCHDPRSCDDCHGTRVPHSADYMDTDNPATMMIHAYDFWRIGDMCYNCHFPGNASGAELCSSCHGIDYLAPQEREELRQSRGTP